MELSGTTRLVTRVSRVCKTDPVVAAGQVEVERVVDKGEEGNADN